MSNIRFAKREFRNEIYDNKKASPKFTVDGQFHYVLAEGCSLNMKYICKLYS